MVSRAEATAAGWALLESRGVPDAIRMAIVVAGKRASELAEVAARAEA